MESYIDLRKMAKNEDFVLNHKEKVSSKNAMDDRKKENSKYAFSDAQKRYLPLKRAFDILISSVALIVCLPLFFVIAFLIKIDSKGPVIFKQPRVGKNGELFTVYKFRTMYTKAPKAVATAKLVNSDMFITRVGKFIRAASIDELPQLMNVLKGDMSIVGPRPLVENEVDVHTLRKEKNVYMLRPGVTGLAQTMGRDLVGTEEKVALDEKLSQELFLA